MSAKIDYTLHNRLSLTQTLKGDKKVIRTKNKNYWRQREFELSNLNLYRFCSKGISERIQLIERLNNSSHAVILFKCLSHRDSTVDRRICLQIRESCTYV